VLGVWAHRQALALTRAGAEVRVLVLHRVVPPQAAFEDGPGTAAHVLLERLRQPLHEIRDGLPVSYVPYISPPRPGFYHSWGAWSAPPLGLALNALRSSFGFEIVHAHNAIPAGDAVHRTNPPTPVVTSVHGADVLYTARRGNAGTRAVSRALRAATLVLANSNGIAQLARRYGGRRVRVVHLGADMPTPTTSPPAFEHASASGPALVTVGHLVPRKRHADVVRALACLRERHPALRYVIIGDGPERGALEALASSLGVAARVELQGQLDPDEALARAQRCTLFVMPSTEEAFGVAYIEAMAAGLPAIGARGEAGPEEIAAAGGGLELADAGDAEGLARRIDALLSNPERLGALGESARATVTAHFTWERCAEQTLAAYEQALSAPAPAVS
jgi:teichuronic acid biosynthesis glycosyltransferase TuaC